MDRHETIVTGRCETFRYCHIGGIIYSLIETAKENGLDPYGYLLWVLRNAPQLSETDEAWAESLLPANAPEECYVLQNN